MLALAMQKDDADEFLGVLFAQCLNLVVNRHVEHRSQHIAADIEIVIIEDLLDVSLLPIHPLLDDGTEGL